MSDFFALVDQTTERGDYPYADRVEQDVLVCEATAVRGASAAEDGRPVSSSLLRLTVC